MGVRVLSDRGVRIVRNRTQLGDMGSTFTSEILEGENLQGRYIVDNDHDEKCDSPSFKNITCSIELSIFT